MVMLLSRRDAAQSLGITIQTLSRLIARGELQAYKVGGRVRIAPEALERFLENNQLTMKGVSNDANVEMGV